MIEQSYTSSISQESPGFYFCCPDVIINNIPVHSQKYTSLNDNLYSHIIYVTYLFS